MHENFTFRIWRNIFYSFVLLTKPRIFNISVDFSTLHFFFFCYYCHACLTDFKVYSEVHRDRHFVIYKYILNKIFFVSVKRRFMLQWLFISYEFCRCLVNIIVEISSFSKHSEHLFLLWFINFTSRSFKSHPTVFRWSVKQYCFILIY